MEIFQLQWAWYEEQYNYLFSHPNKTQDEFKNDVKHLLVKYGKEYLENEGSWAGANRWVEFVSKKLPELGYKAVEPITESFWGAYIIRGDDGEDGEWGEIVGKELLQQAIYHNNILEEEMDKMIDENGK